jgi:autotransporter-associated beta strand protein
MIGSGTLTLTNSNNYSGPTVVAGGVLYAGAAGALSPNSAFKISGGTLDASSGSQAIASLIMSSSNAALNLSPANLLTSGGTVVLNGTLNLSGDTGAAVLMLYPNGEESGQFTTTTGLLSGYRLYYGTNELSVVVAGPPSWTNTSGGSWNTGTNWNSYSAPSGAGQGAYVTASTGVPVTITLDTPQTLGVLTLGDSTNNSTAYTLAPGVSGSGSLTMATSDGSAAQIVVTGGSQTISANVVLAGSLTIAPTAGSTLVISGSVNDSASIAGSLLLNDAGTLILSGSNGFTGGTVVTNGTLVLTNNEALAGGSSLTIGDASAFAGGPGGAGSDTGAISSGLNEPLTASPSITPVPEPGTLVLLSAAGVLAAGWSIRRRKRNAELGIKH